MKNMFGCAIAATFLLGACDGAGPESTEAVTTHASVLEEAEAPTVARLGGTNAFAPAAPVPGLSCQTTAPRETREVVMDLKAEFSANLQEKLAAADQKLAKAVAGREGLR